MVAPRGCNELLDALDAGSRVEGGCDFRVVDPRQAFDLLNVEDGVALQKRDFPFDFVTLDLMLRALSRELNVKNDATGILRLLDIRSSFLKEGAFRPRSIRLRKSTDIPTISANCS